MALELSAELRKLQPARVRIQTPGGLETLEPGQTRKRWATMAETISRMEVRKIELLSESGSIIKVLDGEQETQAGPDATAAAVDIGRLVESCLSAVTAQTKALADSLVRMADAQSRQYETLAKRQESLEKMAHQAMQTALDLSAVLASERVEGPEGEPPKSEDDETDAKLRMVERIADLAHKAGILQTPKDPT